MNVIEISENQMVYISGLIGSVNQCLTALNDTLKGASQVRVDSLTQFSAITQALVDIRHQMEKRNESLTLMVQLSQDVQALRDNVNRILLTDTGDRITVDMVDDLRSRINTIENRMITDQQGITNVVIEKVKEALSAIIPDIVDDSDGQLKLFSDWKEKADRKITTLVTQVPILELDQVNQNRHYYASDDMARCVLENPDIIAGLDQNNKAFIIIKTDTGNITIRASKAITLEQGKQIFELHSQGYNDKEVALKLCIAHKQITHYRLHTLGLRVREYTAKSNKKWDVIDDQYLTENFFIRSEYEIAEHLGRSIGAIKRRINTLKLNKPYILDGDIPQPTNEEKEVFI